MTVTWHGVFHVDHLSGSPAIVVTGGQRQVREHGLQRALLKLVVLLADLGRSTGSICNMAHRAGGCLPTLLMLELFRGFALPDDEHLSPGPHTELLLVHTRSSTALIVFADLISLGDYTKIAINRPPRIPEPRQKARRSRPAHLTPFGSA